MPAKYTVVSKRNPSKPDAPQKFYPSFKSSGRTDTDELIRRIGEISTISPADSLATVRALLMVIPQELIRGNIVELGDFGTFRLSVQTDGGEEKAEDVGAKSITGTKVIFAPGKLFKNTLAQIEFKKE